MGMWYCDINCGEVEIISEQQKHKKLGRLFNGEMRNRGRVAIEHRIRCGWVK